MKMSDIQKMTKIAFAKIHSDRVGPGLRDVELARYQALNGKIYQLDEENRQYQEQQDGTTRLSDWKDCDPE